jgi:hypothetical protein
VLPLIEGKIHNGRSLLRRDARGDVTGTLDQLSRLAEATRTVTEYVPPGQ